MQSSTSEPSTREPTLPQPEGYLARFEAVMEEVRAKEAELTQDPHSLVLRTQLGRLKRRAQWYQRRTPHSRHNIEQRSLFPFPYRRPTRASDLDQPL